MAECVCRSKVIPATGFWYAVRYSFLERTYLLVFQGMHTPGIQVRNQVCEGAPIGEGDGDLVGILDDMRVGEDHAVLIQDHAAALPRKPPRKPLRYRVCPATTGRGTSPR